MSMDEHNHADSSPVKTPEWRTVIESAWETLRRQALGLESSVPPLKLSELSQECQSLAAVTAWYENHGNITHAALRLGTSRRALRERLARWRQDHPQLPPPPPPPPVERPKRTKARRRRPAGEQAGVEGHSS